MRRDSHVHFAKPALEQLEARDQPSFLLGGNVLQQLSAPLGQVVDDMQTARGHLQANLHAGMIATPGSAQQQQFFTNAVGNYQQLLTDQQNIHATSAADQNRIRDAAFAEFLAGDHTDLLILTFGRFIGLDPMNTFSDWADQADGIMNSQDVKDNVATMTNTAQIGGIPLIQLVKTP